MAILDSEYRTGDYPKGWYHCSSCEACHCKLWRTRAWELEPIVLFCGPCAIASKLPDRPLALIDEEGIIYGLGVPTYSIGTMVPAIPESGIEATFYPHLRDTASAWAWWLQLPSYPVDTLRTPRWRLIRQGTGL